MRQIFLTLLIISKLIPVFAQKQDLVFGSKDNLMPGGIYYYPEAWKKGQWARDIKKMKDLGFEFVHMSEFA